MDANENARRPEKLHSVESASELLGGVAASTLRMWIAQGRLTRVKIGRLTRVRESELLALIDTGSSTRKSTFPTPPSAVKPGFIA